MSDINNNMIRIAKLLREHQANEQTLDGIDAETGVLEAKVAANDDRAKLLNVRQDEIAAELMPAMHATGPVTWRDRHTDYLVRTTPLGGIAIEELRSWGALASAMRPRMFTDEAIVEAARHAAVNGEFPHPDDDDTGEFAPVVDAPKDEYLYALERVGAMDPGDDSIQLSDGDSIPLPFNAYIARNGGRTPTIANGVTVSDQAAS